MIEKHCWQRRVGGSCGASPLPYIPSAGRSYITWLHSEPISNACYSYELYLLGVRGKASKAALNEHLCPMRRHKRLNYRTVYASERSGRPSSESAG